MDFDRNVHPIEAYGDKEKLGNLQVVQCVDQMKFLPDRLVSDGAPLAMVTALKALNQWPDGSKASDWGDKDVLVIDSGSVMAESAMRRNMALNGREGKRPLFGDYQAAHEAITNFLLMAKSNLKCHFIMITHLFLMGPDLSAGDIENDALAERVIEKKLEGADNVPWKLAPKTVGRALHDMAKHFSGVIYITARGPERKMLLRPADGVDAGVPVAGLPSELNIKDGLAKIFLASQ